MELFPVVWLFPAVRELFLTWWNRYEIAKISEVCNLCSVESPANIWGRGSYFVDIKSFLE